MCARVCVCVRVCITTYVLISVCVRPTKNSGQRRVRVVRPVAGALHTFVHNNIVCFFTRSVLFLLIESVQNPKRGRRPCGKKHTPADSVGMSIHRNRTITWLVAVKGRKCRHLPKVFLGASQFALIFHSKVVQSTSITLYM